VSFAKGFAFAFAEGFEYDDATLKDLRKVVPNIRQAIMWSYEVWSELDAQIVRNCWRMARILLKRENNMLGDMTRH
jgi:hypothetical protein